MPRIGARRQSACAAGTREPSRAAEHGRALSRLDLIGTIARCSRLREFRAHWSARAIASAEFSALEGIKMMNEVRPRETVVITGASAGVGRAVAREFGRHGARVGLIARGRDGLEAACHEIEADGGEAAFVVADVAQAGQVEHAASVFEEKFGPIDIWINNAMVSVFSPVIEMKPEEYRRVTEVTYLGAVHGTLAALKRMRARDHGTIVQVGSALAYRGIPLQSAYCASKHAIRGFCDSLRSELIHDGSRVHVTEVHLPAMNTPQFKWVKSRLPRRAKPVPPIYQPEVAARAIYWAAHHREREMWVAPSTIKAVLGEKFAQGYLDRYLARNGFDSQQTDEPEDPERPDNLWTALPRDWGAHGGFDDQARERSLEVWLATHRPWTRTARDGRAAASNGRASRAEKYLKPELVGALAAVTLALGVAAGLSRLRDLR
jgi:NAD(P)-dependent dehydrogenase (short-subunit alcohol dehydrogenase family)